MKRGAIVASGHPADVITEELVHEVFDLACRVIDDPVAGTPMVVPIGRHFAVSADAAPSEHDAALV